MRSGIVYCFVCAKGMVTLRWVIRSMECVCSDVRRRAENRDVLRVFALPQSIDGHAGLFLTTLKRYVSVPGADIPFCPSLLTSQPRLRNGASRASRNPGLRARMAHRADSLIRRCPSWTDLVLLARATDLESRWKMGQSQGTEIPGQVIPGHVGFLWTLTCPSAGTAGQ